MTLGPARNYNAGMSRNPDVEIALSQAFKVALREVWRHLRRDGVTQKERVGLWVTTLRRHWPGEAVTWQHGYWSRTRSRRTWHRLDPGNHYALTTDPRFWVDVCVVARPKEHPMINAVAERARAQFDEEDPDYEGSLAVVGELLGGMRATIAAADKLVRDATSLRSIAEVQMQSLGITNP